MKTVRPFSNASEFMAWRSGNCDICTKDCLLDDDGSYGETLCKTEEEISLASVSAGEISEEAGKIANLHFDGVNFTCSELVKVT